MNFFDNFEIQNILLTSVINGNATKTAKEIEAVTARIETLRKLLTICF